MESIQCFSCHLKSTYGAKSSILNRISSGPTPTCSSHQIPTLSTTILFTCIRLIKLHTSVACVTCVFHVHQPTTEPCFWIPEPYQVDQWIASGDWGHLTSCSLLCNTNGHLFVMLLWFTPNQTPQLQQCTDNSVCDLTLEQWPFLCYRLCMYAYSVL